MRKKSLSLILFLTLLLFSMTSVRANAQGTTMSVIPSSVEVPDINEIFSVNVTITDVTNLYSYQFQVLYKSSILEGINITLPSDHFCKNTTDPGFLVVQNNATKVFNATHNVASFALTQLAPEPPKNGSGTLAQIFFESIALGYTTLRLRDVIVMNSTAGFVEVTKENGEVTVIPEFPAALIIPLFMIATLVAVILGKKVWLGKQRGSFVPK